MVSIEAKEQVEDRPVDRRSMPRAMLIRGSSRTRSAATPRFTGGTEDQAETIATANQIPMPKTSLGAEARFVSGICSWVATSLIGHFLRSSSLPSRKSQPACGRFTVKRMTSRAAAYRPASRSTMQGDQHDRGHQPGPGQRGRSDEPHRPGALPGGQLVHGLPFGQPDQTLGGPDDGSYRVAGQIESRDENGKRESQNQKVQIGDQGVAAVAISPSRDVFAAPVVKGRDYIQERRVGAVRSSKVTGATNRLSKPKTRLRTFLINLLRFARRASGSR